MPVNILINVDLPLPDLPTTAHELARRDLQVDALAAPETGPPGVWYTFVRPRRSMMVRLHPSRIIIPCPSAALIWSVRDMHTP